MTGNEVNSCKWCGETIPGPTQDAGETCSAECAKDLADEIRWQNRNAETTAEPDEDQVGERGKMER